MSIRTGDAANGRKFLAGAGSPEGVVTAAIGDIYTDNASGSLYIKKAGTPLTGWAAVGGGGAGPVRTDIGAACTLSSATVINKQVFIYLPAANTGVAVLFAYLQWNQYTLGGFQLTLPNTVGHAYNGWGGQYSAAAQLVDNGVQSSNPALVMISGGSRVIQLYKDFAFGAFAAFGGSTSTMYFTITYDMMP